MSNAQDHAFLQLATRRALVTGAHLPLLEAAMGRDSPLPQAAIEARVLGPAQVAGLLRDLARSAFACPRCGVRLGYDGLASLPRLACPRCQGPLVSTADGELGATHESGRFEALQATGTGAHPAVRPTGAYSAAAGPPTGTGAHPAVRPTGAYPAAVGPPTGTGAHPAVRPTGAYPAAPGPMTGTGAYPAARPTGTYPGPAPPAPSTGGLPAVPTPATGAPPAPAAGAGRPAGGWDIEKTVLDRRRGPAAAAARAAASEDVKATTLDRGGRGRRGRPELEGTLKAQALVTPAREPAPELPQAEVGRRIGPYLIERELGRGAGGVIYLARHQALERQCALKVLVGARRHDADALERFRVEAAVASKIAHPGIVGVFDTGLVDGHHYYAMDYCAGQTLAERLAAGPLPPDEAARTVAALARTAQAAHDQGVIHRDLKPANVILERDTGRPRITDFGVARDDALSRSLTRTGELLGTPTHMAPEQLLGTSDVDHRADVWALGVLLFECLTGQLPFQGATAITLAEQVCHGTAPAPSEVKPGLAPELDAICLRALARDPGDRYASARALAGDLERWLEGDSLAESLLAPVSGKARRRLVALGAGGLALIGLTGALVAAAPRLLAERPPPPIDPTHEARRRVEAAEALDRARALLEQDGAPPAAVWDQLARARDRHPAGAAEVEGLAMRLRARAAVERGLAEAEAADAAARPLAEVRAPLDAALAAAGTDRRLRARVTLALAATLRRRGRWAEAVRAAEDVVAEPGRDGLEARWTRGLALHFLGRTGEAQEALRQLEADDPGGPQGLAAGGLLAVLQSRFDRALDPLERAQQGAREPGVILALRAFVLSALGQREESVRVFRDAAAAAPNDVVVLTTEAKTVLTRQRGRSSALERDRGVELLERAIALGEPDPSPDALHVRGLLLLGAGRLEDAAADLARAAKARPDDARFLFWDGLARLERAPEEAAEAMRRAHRLDREAVMRQLDDLDPRTRQHVARLLGVVEFGDRVPGVAVGQVTAEARQRHERRASAVSLPARGPLLEAWLVAARGEPLPRVREAVERATAAAPSDPAVALDAARLLVARDAYLDDDPASAALARARSLGADARALDLLDAELALRRGRWGKALAGYEALAKADPRGTAGRCAAAQHALMQGRLDVALEAARAALREAPDHVPTRVVEVLVLSGPSGDPRRAVELAAEVLAQDGACDTRLLIARYGAVARVILADVMSGRQGRDKLAAAEQAYREVVELAPGAACRLEFALLCLSVPIDWIVRAGQQELGQARHLEPERADVAAGVALYYILGGHHAEAEAALRFALAREPTDQLVLLAVAEFERKTGRRLDRR